MRLLRTATAILVHRRLLFWLGLGGGALGLLVSLFSARTYTSTATIIPERSSTLNSPALALAASQFGITLPTVDASWGPAMYVELLRSREFLRRIAQDTFVVAEEGGRSITISDLLQIEGRTQPLEEERTVEALRRRISVTEDRELGAVRLGVTTEWPSISFALAQRLIEDADQFNVKTRQAQAAAERRFVEQQAEGAREALLAAEDRLKGFLERNRALNGSPELEFERDRLERDVALRQQIYTMLASNLEETRIREVRNTPLISMLETPRLEPVPDPRGLVQKTALGALGGVILAMVAAMLVEGTKRARRLPGADAAEFFRLLEGSMPRVFRRIRER